MKIAGKGLDNKKGLDDKRLDTRGLDEKTLKPVRGEVKHLSSINPAALDDKSSGDVGDTA